MFSCKVTQNFVKRHSVKTYFRFNDLIQLFDIVVVLITAAVVVVVIEMTFAGDRLVIFTATLVIITASVSIDYCRLWRRRLRVPFDKQINARVKFEEN